MRAYEIVAGSNQSRRLAPLRTSRPRAAAHADFGAHAGRIAQLPRSAHSPAVTTWAARRRQHRFHCPTARARSSPWAPRSRDFASASASRAPSFAAGSTASRRAGRWSHSARPPRTACWPNSWCSTSRTRWHCPRIFPHAGAATLPCAAVTAWRALVDIGHIAPGETVLVLGTGGVSIFALQFARLAGARVLLPPRATRNWRARKSLGADGCINYRTHPEWEREVLKLTGRTRRRSRLGRRRRRHPGAFHRFGRGGWTRRHDRRAHRRRRGGQSVRPARQAGKSATASSSDRGAISSA